MPVKRLIQYGIVGALAIVLLGIAYYFVLAGDKPASTAKTAPASTPIAADDEPAVPTDAQNEKVMQLVAKARQLAQDGKFDEADSALQRADNVVPNAESVLQARRDLAGMRTPAGQLETQLTKARYSIEHGDYSAADKALAAAEQLNAQAPQIAELRQTMEKAKAKDTRRDNRIAEHLAAMRQAIAHNDFAAADSELDAAERVDLDDPTVRAARRELVHARSAVEKGDSGK